MAYLVLSNGAVFEGRRIGAPLDRMGELVFNGASAAFVDAVERALNTKFISIPIPPEDIEEALKNVQ